MSDAGQMRAFLAVDLAVPTVRRVAEAQGALRAAAASAGWRVGWVSPAQMHVTLKFLGGVRRELATAIEDRLARALAAFSPFEVEAASAGAFPSEGRPHVLWIGLRGDDGRLVRLAGEVDAAMEGLGLVREARAFHPHVTVGRVKEAQGGADSVIAGLGESSFGTSIVREVVLYESHTLPSGAKYTPLARVPLGARRA
ncbi:MAG: RNA 2',3'-cyclic phosphodiesterase [Myxococcota bacterium]